MELVELNVLAAVVAGILGTHVHFLQVLVLQLVHKELRLVEYLADHANFEKVTLGLLARHPEVKLNSLVLLLRLLLLLLVVV